MVVLPARDGVTGILLAAGRGRRFDPSGQRSKLAAPCANGIPVAVHAARNLRAALPRVVAVVRPQEQALAQALLDEGCEICTCDGEAMSDSLRHGLAQALDAAGWVFALGDMPGVAPVTIQQLARALAGGAGIAVPRFAGRRGNPVAFAARYRNALLALQGDRGARELLVSNPVHEIEVIDPGILFDIDTPADLGTFKTSA